MTHDLTKPWWSKYTEWILHQMGACSGMGTVCGADCRYCESMLREKCPSLFEKESELPMNRPVQICTTVTEHEHLYHVHRITVLMSDGRIFQGDSKPGMSYGKHNIDWHEVTGPWMLPPSHVPPGVEVLRANADAVCSACNRPYSSHHMVHYMGLDYGPVIGCDGRYYHL